MENPSFMDDFPSYKPPRFLHVWEARRVFIVLKARLVSLCNPHKSNLELMAMRRWPLDLLRRFTWWFCFLTIYVSFFGGGSEKSKASEKKNIFGGVLLNLREYLTFFWVEIWQIPWTHEENRRPAAPCQPQHSRPHDGRTDSMVLREKFQLNYDQEERSQWFYDFHGYHRWLIVHGYHPELIIVDVF